MVRRLFTWVIMVSCLSCSSGIKLQFQQPVQGRLIGIKKLVIAPGDGADEAALIGNLLTNLLQQTNYFELYDSRKFSVALEQNGLTFQKIKQSDSVNQIGKLLKVDGIIFTELKKLELLPDEQGVEKVQKSVWTGEYERDANGEIIEELSPTGQMIRKRKYKLEFVEQHYRIRKARIETAFKLIDLKRGSLIIDQELAKNYASDKIIKEESHRVPTDDEIKSILALEVAQHLINEIAPRAVYVKRIIETGTASIDSGAVQAKQGHWDKAREIWAQAQKTFSTDARLYYNLGLVAEAQGDYESAQIFYRQASLLIPKKKLYQKAIQNIQKVWQQKPK